MTSFMPFRRWSGSVRIFLVLPIFRCLFQAFAPGGPNGQGRPTSEETLTFPWDSALLATGYGDGKPPQKQKKEAPKIPAADGPIEIQRS